MIIINDIDDDKIALYKNLRYTPAEHAHRKIFISEGEKCTQRLLKSDLEIIGFFATEEYYEKYSELILKKNIPEDNKLLARKQIMEKIVGYNLHTGIMALARQPEDIEIKKMSSPIITLNGINNAENVGSIVRNCTAFGITCLIADKNSCSPFLRRSFRVSMGAALEMKVRHSSDLQSDLKGLKDTGFKIISAELTGNAISIMDFIFPEKFVLVFGSEANGVSNEILILSDYIVKIPISYNINSLNVASSSAIFLNRIAESCRISKF